ncbi:thioredoxin family protein [Cronbergia sp. UHCC 0137]|uniref:TlpA family protein disulfide reductase n=1 Tax=Cronbergia sp. UHCC 0137 TaxID=3110239 RepID=UPI002B1F6483|nr:thioredoxin family protein [Cronbergia sp. UHCC 0137]MEA5618485.1 thioredoxin family protein [Cronbergia sp. UHCC 0137]
MHKHANLLLKICLSSLVLTGSMVGINSASISAEAESQSSIAKIAQANLSTAKANVGGPLAKELQGKPLVVDVFATWCSGCKNIAPTLSQLKQEYSGKVNFVVLDVTDKATFKQTEAMAEKLGLGKFLENNKSKTSTVAIVDPATGNILALYQNNPNKAEYTKILKTALAKN